MNVIRLFLFAALLSMVQFTFAEQDLASANELRNAFLTERVAGTRKIANSLLTDLKAQLATEMKQGDLDNANKLNSLIQHLELEVETLEADNSKTFTFPGTEELSLPDPMEKSIAKHEQWLEDGLAHLGKKHLPKMVRSQKLHLTAGDLNEANRIEEEIRSLEAVIGEEKKESVVQSQIDFLDEELRDQWKEEKGIWVFRGNRLIGEGDSKIGFHAPMQPPFVLSWRHEVKEGQRPRVYVENFTIAHFDYDFKISLHPKLKSQKTYKYKRDRAIDVEFVVDREFVELWVEGEKIDRRVAMMPETISAVYFGAGDNWSPGVTQFSRIVVSPGGREED